MNTIGKYQVHTLADLVPMALPAEQVALQKDIEMHGQQEPITLYRNKIVDGRCRAMACLALNIEVKSETLPNNLSITEVANRVKSLNTRRNLTMSQKAIVAAKQYLADNSVKQKDVYVSWGIGKKEFAAARYLLTNRPDYAEVIFKGGKVPIADGKSSWSVRIVAGYVATEIENMRSSLYGVVADTSDDFTHLITTQAGKTNYVELMKIVSGGDVNGFEAYTYDGNLVRKLLAQMADHFIAPRA